MSPVNAAAVPGVLDPLVRDPRASAVVSDFDGTLAAIVEDPEAARPLPGATEALRRLAERFSVVGVVSGRPASFLVEHLASAGDRVHLVGLYGLEWVEGGEVRRLMEVEPWLDAVSSALTRARAEAPPGIGVEAKGASVVLHWRKCPQLADRALQVADSLAASTGLVVRPARMSVEILPPVATDKGLAIVRLVSGSAAACFIGDDIGDLAAFDALDRLAAEGTTAVRIAVADEESPPELAERADVVLSAPSDAVDLLFTLAAAAEGQG